MGPQSLHSQRVTVEEGTAEAAGRRSKEILLTCDEGGACFRGDLCARRGFCGSASPRLCSTSTFCLLHPEPPIRCGSEKLSVRRGEEDQGAGGTCRGASVQGLLSLQVCALPCVGLRGLCPHPVDGGATGQHGAGAGAGGVCEGLSASQQCDLVADMLVPVRVTSIDHLTLCLAALHPDPKRSRVRRGRRG